MNPNSICGPNSYFCFIDPETKAVYNLADQISLSTDDSFNLILTLNNQNSMNSTTITMNCVVSYVFNPLTDVNFVGKRDTNNLIITMKSSNGVKIFFIIIVSGVFL